MGEKTTEFICYTHFITDLAEICDFFLLLTNVEIYSSDLAKIVAFSVF